MVCFKMPDGELLAQYCKRTGIRYMNVYRRLDEGLTLEQALKEAEEIKQGKNTRLKVFLSDGTPLWSYCKGDRSMYNKIYRKVRS